MKKFILSVLACGYLVAGINDGLVAHYEFEGNAKDSSGNGNDGVEYGGVSYVDGVIGKAGSFDGVDDEIHINTFWQSGKTDEPFSISIWVNINDDNRKSNTIFSQWTACTGKNDHYGLLVYGDIFANSHGFRSEIYGSDISKVDRNILVTGNWHNIISSFDGKEQKLYIDGEFIKSKSFNSSNLISYENVDVVIGGFAKDLCNYGSSNYYGFLDDLRIYNRALSEDEITELYNLKDSSNCNCDCNSQTTTNSELLEFNIKEGWNLMGSSKDITNLDSIFNKDCVNTIFAYNGSSWSKYIPNQEDNIKSINKHEGFWIYGNDNCTLTEELVPPSPN